MSGVSERVAGKTALSSGFELTLTHPLTHSFPTRLRANDRTLCRSATHTHTHHTLDVVRASLHCLLACLLASLLLRSLC